MDMLERGETVDLMVTDLHMPEIDGWKLCRLVRSREFSQYNNIPVLATSAIFAGSEVKDIAFGLGANALLVAPFTAAELVNSVYKLLSGDTYSSRPTVLLLPGPHEELVGLGGAFQRAGFRVVRGDVDTACSHLEVTRPQVAIVWEGHPEEQLKLILQRAWDRTSACVSIVLMDEVNPSSQVRWLSQGADACVKTPLESDYLVFLSDKLSRARAMMRIQDALGMRSAELRASHETFQLLFEGIPDSVLLFDLQGVILSINQNGAEQLDSLPNNIVGRKVTDFIFSDELLAVLEHRRESAGCFKAVCASCSGIVFEAEIHHRSISYRGESANMAIIKDLSEQLVAQQVLQFSETKYRILADNTYDWEFWRSPEGHFLYSSPACAQITGYEHFEFEMDVQFLRRLIDPDDRHRLPTNLQEELEEVVEVEFHIIDRQGEKRWVALKSRPVYDEQGNLLGCRGTIRDLTQHKQVENERGKLTAAIEQCAERVAITDVEGRLEYVNPSFEKAFQGDSGPCQGQIYSLFNEPEVQEAVKKTEVWSGRRVQRNQAGKEETREITLSPVRDGAKVLSNWVLVERDVTSELQLQERLLQAQRMEAVGSLAGGVAHDFNNLLSGILGYASLLKASGSTREETIQAAEVIETAARRAANLTQKLLGFARQGKHKHEGFSVHDCVAEVLTLLSRSTDPRILSEGMLDAENPWIIGDAGQINQVFMNLCINAAHSMGDGGRLIIRTTNTTVDLCGKPLDPGQPEREHLRITVEDTGCGIEPENLQRIFEPFYTTKEHGSGLGLAMIYGIVQNHDGTIVVQSQPGRGTTFTLHFPSHHEGRAAEPKRAPMKGGRGKILVVDDEELVRNVACKMLSRLGYEVTSSSDGLNAVSYYREHAGEIDLVILDMLMPKMDGRECFRQLKSINPTVRAILSTGYSHNETVQEVLNEGLSGYISKPYVFSQLAEIVGQLISGGEN